MVSTNSSTSRNVVLPCPSCGQPTDSLKQFRLLDLVVFIFVGATWRYATYTACPSCMRGRLLSRTLVNLLPANLLWPILVLPMHGVQFVRTYLRGTSPSVLKLLDEAGAQPQT